jgi:mycothiol synthase
MVAHHNNRMIGFYWTKVHDFAHLSSAEPVGEVYICGVIPEFQGQGIGSALVVTALKYLRKIGMTSAMLYVDTRDAKTVKLYEKLGFVTWDSDTLYTKDLTQ